MPTSFSLVKKICFYPISLTSNVENVYNNDYIQAFTTHASHGIPKTKQSSLYDTVSWILACTHINTFVHPRLQ